MLQVPLQPVNYTTSFPKGVTITCKDDTTFRKSNLKCFWKMFKSYLSLICRISW